MRTKLIVLLAVGILVLSGEKSEAACTISTTSVSFGTYNVFNAAPVDSTGSITYRCGIIEALFVTVRVTLSAGQSGSFAARTMRKGTETLAYNFYLDAALTSVWGDGTGGTQVYSRTRPPAFTDVTVAVYGRIPANQDVSAGAYSDNVSAVINF